MGDTAETVLYRPVGETEPRLIEESGWRAFPPAARASAHLLPVLDEGYAARIARDWNTKDAASGYAGYVTRFGVRTGFISRYPVRTVGARVHQELWIPAEELEEMDANLVRLVEVIAGFHGDASDASGQGGSTP